MLINNHKVCANQWGTLDWSYDMTNSDGSIDSVSRRIECRLDGIEAIFRTLWVEKLIPSAQLELSSYAIDCENSSITSLTLISRQRIKEAPENPLTSAINILNNQVANLTQSNTVLSTVVNQKNEVITQLNNQVSSLRGQIDSLNETVNALRQQVAVIPALQQQIDKLEGQVATLTSVLMGILSQIVSLNN